MTMKLVMKTNIGSKTILKKLFFKFVDPSYGKFQIECQKTQETSGSLKRKKTAH